VLQMLANFGIGTLASYIGRIFGRKTGLHFS
jgi:hypothetical protein